MINVSFYQNQQKMDKNGLMPIYMLLTFNGQRIRKSLRNFKLKKQHWNSKKGRVRPAKDDFRIHETLNSKLESIEETIHKINKTVLKFDIPLSEDYILSRLENPDSIEVSGRDLFTTTDYYLKAVETAKATRLSSWLIGAVSSQVVANFATTKDRVAAMLDLPSCALCVITSLILESPYSSVFIALCLAIFLEILSVYLGVGNSPLIAVSCIVFLYTLMFPGNGMGHFVNQRIETSVHWRAGVNVNRELPVFMLNIPLIPKPISAAPKGKPGGIRCWAEINQPTIDVSDSVVLLLRSRHDASSHPENFLHV